MSAWGSPSEPGAIVVLAQIHPRMMGDTMKATLGKTVLAAALAVAVLGVSGCGMKWLQSDGDEVTRASGEGAHSGWNGQGVNPNFPGMTQEGSRRDLSGFSQNPSDEYLAGSGGIASVSPAAAASRHHAEVTREERAAIEAGLKDVFFGYDQWTLSDSARDALHHNAEWLKAHPGAVLKVEGHCDERGTAAYNLVLGEKRANAVKRYLQDLGVPASQLQVTSYGEARPFCTQQNEDCYQQNRRAHFVMK